MGRKKTVGIRVGSELSRTFLLEIIKKRNMDPHNQIKRGMHHATMPTRVEGKDEGSMKQ